MTVDIELGPGHLPAVLIGPQLPLLLLSISFMPEVETVDWLPVAVFVPENYQNLGSVGLLPIKTNQNIPKIVPSPF